VANGQWPRLFRWPGRSRSTVHGPRSTVHGPRSTVHGPRSTVHGASRFSWIGGSTQRKAGK
jgi:hypothetical protein